MQQAAELFEDFTGHEASYYEKIPLNLPKVGLTVGKCLGLIYETTRDGEVEQYIHRFKKHAQPRFVVSFDGRQLLLVGGKFRFTNAGIVDSPR